MAVRRALYILPWVLAIVVQMSPLGNTSWCIEGVLICLQRSAHLVPKPSGELLVVLNDLAVLVSDAGTGWTLSLEASLVITLFLRLWIGSSVLSGAPRFCGRHDVS